MGKQRVHERILCPLPSPMNLFLFSLLSGGRGEPELSLDGTEPSRPRGSNFGDVDFMNKDPPAFEMDLLEAQNSAISAELTILHGVNNSTQQINDNNS